LDCTCIEIIWRNKLKIKNCSLSWEWEQTDTNDVSSLDFILWGHKPSGYVNSGTCYNMDDPGGHDKRNQSVTWHCMSPLKWGA
jgi:hypothetical protein